jgi:hypothetical protein
VAFFWLFQEKALLLRGLKIFTTMRQLKITKSITNRESAALEKYLQEISKETMISAEEEVELAAHKKGRPKSA